MENNNTALTIDFTDLNPIFAQSELCKHVLLLLLLQKNNIVPDANINDVFQHNIDSINVFAALKSNELSHDIIDSVASIASSNTVPVDLLESSLKAVTLNLADSICHNDVPTIIDDILTINNYCLYISDLDLEDIILSNDANENISIYLTESSQVIDVELTINGDSYRIIDEYSTVDCVAISLEDETLCYLNTSFLYDYCDLENCTVVIDAIKETMDSEALKLILNTSLQDIASDMISLDGAGHCLNSYDGGNEEIYNNGDTYFYFAV